MKSDRIQTTCARISLAAIALFGLASCKTTSIFSKRTSPAGVNEQYREVLYQRSTQYRIRPGDNLQVDFFGATEYSQTLFVLPDGRADPFFMGNAVVAGKTVKEFEEEIKDAYKDELNEPVVSVGVAPFPEVIYLVGTVLGPQTLPYRLNMTLTQAILEARNYLDTASLDDIILRRPYSNPRNPDIFYVDYYDESEEIFLLPDDEIIVTRTTWIVIRDYVREYIFGFVPIESITRSAAGGGAAF